MAANWICCWATATDVGLPGLLLKMAMSVSADSLCASVLTSHLESGKWYGKSQLKVVVVLVSGRVSVQAAAAPAISQATTLTNKEYANMFAQTHWLPTSQPATERKG